MVTKENISLVFTRNTNASKNSVFTMMQRQAQLSIFLSFCLCACLCACVLAFVLVCSQNPALRTTCQKYLGWYAIIFSSFLLFRVRQNDDIQVDTPLTKPLWPTKASRGLHKMHCFYVTIPSLNSNTFYCKTLSSCIFWCILVEII